MSGLLGFDPVAALDWAAEPKKGKGNVGSGGGGSPSALASPGQKRPACILAFTLPPGMYNMNLTPDKQEVMLTRRRGRCPTC